MTFNYTKIICMITLLIFPLCGAHNTLPVFQLVFVYSLVNCFVLESLQNFFWRTQYFSDATKMQMLWQH